MIMKGIYYDRHECTDKEDWHQPVAGETITVNKTDFLKFFPETQIQSEIEWQCDRGRSDDCGDCQDCGCSVKLIFDEEGGFLASYSNEIFPPHQIDDFSWHWSGCGVREWWFDNQAICLASTNDYRSGTGLTAESSRIVAFNRKVEVDSFRGDCPDETDTTPVAGKIWAEFINAPADYRANWTGFAVGLVGDGDGRYTASGGWVSGGTPIIGDRLDEIIEIMLSCQPETITTCKHNKKVQAHVVVSDQKKLPLYLCKSCRMRGIRWEEFANRNRRDTCPYFRRACKSVVDKSDKFPDWFQWSGDNLLAAQRRLSDGDYEAFEVTYIRRKEGFVRRAVLLLNNRTHEAWMYRYNGFIPRNMADFRAKYTEGRQILGYMATGAETYTDDPEDRFLTSEKVFSAIAQGLEQPLWQNEKLTLTPFRMERHHQALDTFAIWRGGYESTQITQYTIDEEGVRREINDTPEDKVLFKDKELSFILIESSYSHIRIRHQGETVYDDRKPGGERYFLLRVKK